MSLYEAASHSLCDGFVIYKPQIGDYSVKKFNIGHVILNMVMLAKCVSWQPLSVCI